MKSFGFRVSNAITRLGFARPACTTAKQLSMLLSEIGCRVNSRLSKTEPALLACGLLTHGAIAMGLVTQCSEILTAEERPNRSDLGESR